MCRVIWYMLIAIYESWQGNVPGLTEGYVIIVITVLPLCIQYLISLIYTDILW